MAFAPSSPLLARKVLIERGVARPFHRTWTFLSSPAYVFGRSLIVRSLIVRRTVWGIAPMWAVIAMHALTAPDVWTGLLFSQLFQQLSTSTSY